MAQFIPYTTCRKVVGGNSAIAPPAYNITFMGGTLDSSLTFTRASSGYYYNSSGILTSASTNVPRFDYNPTTLSLNGLLMESNATNISTYSQQIGGTNWSPSGGCTAAANNATAPDGTTTATLLTAANTQSYFINQTGTTTSGTYAVSVYVKQGTNPTVVFGLSDNVANSAEAIFNFNTLTITGGGTAGNGTVIGSPYYQSLPNGWYRLFLIVNFSGSTSSMGVVVGPLNNFSGGSTNGNTVYCWGAQYENSNFVSSYIQTTNASATRALDSVQCSNIAFYNQNAGSFIGTWLDPFPYAGNLLIAGTTLTRTIGCFSDGTINNRLHIFLSAGADTLSGRIVNAGTAYNPAATANSYTINAINSAGMVYGIGANAAFICLNGSTETFSSPVSLPTGATFTDGLRIGCQYTGNYSQIQGWMQTFAYYNYSLTPAQLSALT